MGSQSEPAVGIDLGTTFSAIACLDAGGSPRTLPNLDGDVSTPSVVYFQPSGPVVGKEAVKVARYEPDAVAQFAKRDMGKSEYRRPICGRTLPPEAIQALILRKLKQDAAAKLGEFRKVVITVPAFFNEPRRKATMDAGALAGLEVLDIINEPTAAALAYGVLGGFLSASGQTQAKETVMVYDLGGGTFDVTLMEIDGSSYRTLATDGDVFLGGIDWDQRIVDHVADKFWTEHGEDPHANPEAYQALLQESEDAKRALSAREKVVVHFSMGRHRSAVPLTRDRLESMTEDLVQRTIFTAGSLLRDAGRKWSDLTRVLLVGGASRMPMIEKALARESSVRIDRSLLAEEPVALGAAIYAGFLLRGSDSPRSAMSIRNVNSHHLGVLAVERETGLRRRKILIPRNTPLPATGAGVFNTLRDNQRGLLVNVIEGGDDSGNNATPIGRYVVSGLPPGLPAGTRVTVRFDYGTNGRLTVTASLPGMVCQIVMTVERATGLSEAAVAAWRSRIESGRLIETGDEEQVLVVAPAAEGATGTIACDQTRIEEEELRVDLSELQVSSGKPQQVPPPLPSGSGPPPDNPLEKFLRELD